MQTLQLEYQFLNLVVEGDYIPEEQPVQYGNDLAGYPGSPAEFKSQKIYLLNDTDQQDLINVLNEEQIQEINEIALKLI